MAETDGSDADPVATAAPGEKADGTPDLGITVALDSFSGPLDLLLFLVRRSEVDIADIPIGEIADQFIATITGWQDLDLEVGGEFVLMAATLLEIKSRMVAPPTEEAEEGVTEEEKELYDPRKGLIGRLLAYRRFKEVAQALTNLEAAQNLRAARHYREQVPEDPAEADALDLENAEPGYLAKLWFTIERRISGLGPRTVVKDSEPIEVRIAKLVEQLQATGQIRLFQIFALEPLRMSRVTTVMAMLESTRQRFITVEQPEQYGDVDLRFRPEDKRAVIRMEFPPLPEEKKRKRRPPLATWHQTVETPGDEDAPPPAEDSSETDEQRFLRELEEACRLEEVLSRGGNLELGFAEYWAKKRGLPWPPPAPEAPAQQTIPGAPAAPAAAEAAAALAAPAAPAEAKAAEGEQKPAVPAAAEGKPKPPAVAVAEGEQKPAAVAEGEPKPAAATEDKPATPVAAEGDQPKTAAPTEAQPQTAATGGSQPAAPADPNAPLVIAAGATGDANATTATAMANALVIEVPAASDAGTTVSTTLGGAHAPLTVDIPATADAGSTVATALGQAPLAVEVPATGDIGSTVSTSLGSSPGSAPGSAPGNANAPLTVEIVPDGAGGTVRTAFGQAPLTIEPHPADGSGATVKTTYGGGNLVIDNAQSADGSGATVKTTHSGPALVLGPDGLPVPVTDPARAADDLGGLITLSPAGTVGGIGAITVDLPALTAEDSKQATERLGHGQVYRDPDADAPVPVGSDGKPLTIDIDPIDPAGATVTMSLAGDGGQGGVVLVDPGEAFSTRMAAVAGPAHGSGAAVPPVGPAATGPDGMITLTPENTPILGEAVIADPAQPGGAALDAVLVDPGPDALESQRMRALATDLGPAIAPAGADSTPGGIAAITVGAPDPAVAGSGDLTVADAAAAAGNAGPVGAITVGDSGDNAGDTVQTTLGKVHPDTQDQRAALLTITLPANEAAGDTVQTTLGTSVSDDEASARIAAYSASRAAMQTVIVSTDEASGASTDRSTMDTMVVSADEASGARSDRSTLDTLIVSTDEASGAAADRAAMETLIVPPNQASGGTLDTIIAPDAADQNRRAAELTITLPPGEAAGATVQTTVGKAPVDPASGDPAEVAKNPALANVHLHPFEHAGNLRIHLDDVATGGDRSALETITVSPNQASGGTLDTVIGDSGAAAAQADRSALETIIVSPNQASGGTLDTVIGDTAAAAAQADRSALETIIVSPNQASGGTLDTVIGDSAAAAAQADRSALDTLIVPTGAAADRSALETIIVSPNQASGGTLDTLIVDPDARPDRAGMITITLPPGAAAGDTVQTTLGKAPAGEADAGVAPITVEMPAVDPRAATATTTEDIPTVARVRPISTDVEIEMPVDPRAATTALPAPTGSTPRTPPPPPPLSSAQIGGGSSRLPVGGGKPPTTSRRATAVTRRVLVNVPFAPAPPPAHRNDPLILGFIFVILGLVAWLGWWFVNHGNHPQQTNPAGTPGTGGAASGTGTGGSTGAGGGGPGNHGGAVTGGGAPTPTNAATGLVIGTTRIGGAVGTATVRTGGSVGTVTLGAAGGTVGTVPVGLVEPAPAEPALTRSAATVGTPRLSPTGWTLGWDPPAPTPDTVTSGHPGTR